MNRTLAGLRPLIAGLLPHRPVQRVQQQTSDVADALAQAAVSDKKQRLLILAFQLRRTIGELEKGAQTLDPKLRPLFLAQVEKFKHPDRRAKFDPQLRQHELDLIADAGTGFWRRITLSTKLTDAAEHLVEVTKQEVRGATGSALRVQRHEHPGDHACWLRSASPLDHDCVALCRPQHRRAPEPSERHDVRHRRRRPRDGRGRWRATTRSPRWGERSRCFARTPSSGTSCWPSALRRRNVWNKWSRSAPLNSRSSKPCCV